MNCHFTWRQACALSVACVLAVHAALMPLSAAATASFGNSICSAASANDVQERGSSDTGGACTVGCGICCPSPSLDEVPAVIVALELQAAASIEILPIAAPTTTVSRSPQSARAPPA
jgi:hypothetical protein